MKTYAGMNAAERLAHYHLLLTSTPMPRREDYRTDQAWFTACNHRENVMQRYSEEYTTAHLAAVLAEESTGK